MEDSLYTIIQGCTDLLNINLGDDPLNLNGYITKRIKTNDIKICAKWGEQTFHRPLRQVIQMPVHRPEQQLKGASTN